VEVPFIIVLKDLSFNLIGTVNTSGFGGDVLNRIVKVSLLETCINAFKGDMTYSVYL
jgi:hypothetical protein